MPLNALRAFEAAARLGSMSAAADELGVTHGAISHHVKSLEERFGLPLLERLPRSVMPTSEGAQLASDVADAFDRLRIAVSRIQPGPVTISCSASIMMRWLIPRLNRFKEIHPSIELRLNTSYGDVDFIRDDISIAIRASMHRAPATAIAETVLCEEIGPICHPDYARRVGIFQPDDLKSARILATATRLDAWKEWSTAIGRSDLIFERQETFEHFYMVIQAAACGLGIAISPLLLVEDEIRSGQLIAPFGFVPGPHDLQLWIANHQRTRADVRAIAEYVRTEMRSLSVS